MQHQQSPPANKLTTHCVLELVPRLIGGSSHMGQHNNRTVTAAPIGHLDVKIEPIVGAVIDYIESLC
jgi:hypothetical protein